MGGYAFSIKFIEKARVVGELLAATAQDLYTYIGKLVPAIR